MVSFLTYGGEIQTYFAKVKGIRFKAGHSFDIDDKDIPWTYFVEAKSQGLHLPLVYSTDTTDHKNLVRANELIAILNATEDFIVFKIAINAVLELVQRNTPPIYPGDKYRPENLEEAMKVEALEVDQ